MQALDEQIEQLEALLFDDRPHDNAVQRRSFELRKSLVQLRRVVLPMREVINALLESCLAIQGNRLNVMTKKVTSWAAIIAVPTAITGFYRQNLPYPGFATTPGLITSSLLIVVGSVGLYILFKRKRLAAARIASSVRFRPLTMCSRGLRIRLTPSGLRLPIALPSARTLLTCLAAPPIASIGGVPRMVIVGGADS